MIVAICGADACGKATLAAGLQEHFSSRMIGTTVRSFPNYETETGKIIRGLLTGQINLSLQISDALANQNRIRSIVLQSCMTVNRYESDVPDWGRYGTNFSKLLLLDRYWLSGLVYGVAEGLDVGWLLRIHQMLVKPDLTLVLDCPVEEGFKRRPERRDRFESDRNLLENVRKLYREAGQSGRLTFGTSFTPDLFTPGAVKLVDATQPVEDVLKAALQFIRESLFVPNIIQSAAHSDP